MKYPVGLDKNDGSKQIAVRFPPLLFEQLIKIAKKEQKDFNATVVDLVKCGKLCIEESDALEIQ